MRNFKINKEQYHPGIVTKTDTLFWNIFNESPDAIFLLDPGNFMITDCNNQALQLFQIGDKKEIRGKQSFNLYDSEPVEFSRAILIETVDSGTKQTQEVAFRTVRGNVFWGCGTFQKVMTPQGSLVVFRVRRVVDYMMTAEMLSVLVKQTSKVTGDAFLQSITELLAKIFGVSMVLVARVNHALQVAETLYYWPESRENHVDHYEIRTGPSMNVVKGYTTFYPSHLSDLFPEDRTIRRLKIESYVGAPIYNSSGEVNGLLVMMDRKPMEEIPNLRFILSMFAARAGAELERLEVEQQMREQIKELETRIINGN
ncbi:MAG: PAS domain-containing protein [Bacteroidales bacterium]|nr:PAS domain-containing protein [Bacteroidales bacterium]